MITPIVAIVALAILFVVFGLLKQRVGCSGSCDACAHGCDFTKDGSNG